MQIIGVIHMDAKLWVERYLGWCPCAKALLPDDPPNERFEAGDVTGGRDADMRWFSRPALILLLPLLPAIISIAYTLSIPIIIVLSVACVYVDAQNINAGGNFEKETLFGDIVAWRPLTWGAATLVGGIIIMAIYIFHRREIYNANYRSDPHGCEIVG